MGAPALLRNGQRAGLAGAVERPAGAIEAIAYMVLP